MSRLTVGILCAVLLLLAGCTGQGRVEAEEPGGGSSPGRPVATLRAEDYFPAGPGMRWRYDGWGNEFAAYTRRVTHRRGDRVQIVHKSGAAVAWVYDLFPDRIVLRALRSEIEDETADFLDAGDEFAQVILQEPLVEGARWRTPTWVPVRSQDASDASPGDTGGGETYLWETRRIEGVGQTLVTPAATFRNVIRVRVTPDEGIESLEYYAPGVGLIRSEHLYEEPIVSTLSRFVIGGE